MKTVRGGNAMKRLKRPSYRSSRLFLICSFAAWTGTSVSAQIISPFASITEYNVPTPASLPCNSALGPDGAEWFIEAVAAKVARLDPQTGSIAEFQLPKTLGPVSSTVLPDLPTVSGLPSPVAFACGINSASDGNVWFTSATGNYFGFINPGNKSVTTYPVPTAGSNIEDIYEGPDNAMWFSEPSTSKIGRFDLSNGQITEYPLSNPLAAPIGVFAASDGNIWFPEFVGNKIGKINPTTKEITEYAIPSPAALPFVLRAETAGGFLWFSEFGANKVGRIAMSTGQITEFTLPTPLSAPVAVTKGGDGNIYAIGGLSQSVVKIEPTTGLVSERRLPIALGSFPEEIRFGAEGRIWIPESLANKILSTPQF
jgi:virginiamycin B lyase